MNPPDTDSEFYTGWIPVDPIAVEHIRREMSVELGNRYQPGEYLGRGAYASVWSAFDQITGEMVAVKRFESKSQKPGGFYRELSNLFRLQHPRIVRIINLMESAKGSRYIILEYCPGGSLRPVISKARRATAPWPGERVAELALQLAQGISVAHQQGLIHRDIKPENILFESVTTLLHGGTSAVKLADFGLSRAYQRASEREGVLNSVSGSPAYMSPEQFTGLFTPASDIYSLGVILFELLHEYLPFEGPPHELARRHLYETPTISPTLSPAWAELLTAMLSKSPEPRPTSDELVRRSHEICAGYQPTGAVTEARATDSPEMLLPSSRKQTPPTLSMSRCLGVSAFKVFVQSHGEAIALAPSGIYRQRFVKGATPTLIPLAGITDGVQDASGSLWLSSGQALWHLAPENDSPTKVFTFREPIRSLGMSEKRINILTSHQLYELQLDSPIKTLWQMPLSDCLLDASHVLRLPDDRFVLTVAGLVPGLMLLESSGEIGRMVELPCVCSGMRLRGSGVWLRCSGTKHWHLFDPRGAGLIPHPEPTLIALGEHGWNLYRDGTIRRDTDEFLLGRKDGYHALATDDVHFAVLGDAYGSTWLHLHMR